MTILFVLGNKKKTKFSFNIFKLLDQYEGNDKSKGEGSGIVRVLLGGSRVIG